MMEKKEKKLFYLSQIVKFIEELGKITQYNLDEVIQKSVKVISSSLQAEKVSLMMIDEKTGSLIIKGAVGIPENVKKNVKIKIGEGISGKVVEEGKPFLTKALKGKKLFRKGKYKTDDFMSLPVNISVPLTMRASVMGVLNVADKKDGSSFDEIDMEFAQTMANVIAIHVENILLYEKNLQKERLAAIGQAIAGIAHYIKNIITALNSSIKVFELVVIDNKKYEKIPNLWKVIKNSTSKITELIKDMLNYSRPQKPQYEKVDFKVFLNDLIQQVMPKIKEKNIDFSFNYDYKPEYINIDPKRIYDSILNILTNAIEAVDECGKITMNVTWDEYLNEAIIVIEDNGPGIPKEVLPHIFEAFFTTKGSKGTGLGLAITKKIIEEHKGKIFVESEEGKGTKFTIKLPVK